MEDGEIQARRLGNQRRILFELIQKLPDLIEPGKDFSKLLNRRFRENRRFGSKDRRLYRELIYTYLRYEPWFSPISESPNRFLDTLIVLADPTPEVTRLYPTLNNPFPTDSPECSRHRLIGKSDDDLKGLIPDWFKNHFSRKLETEDYSTFVSRPPLWLRVQKGDRNSIAEELSIGLEETSEFPRVHSVIPNAILCPKDFPIQKSASYKSGDIEIQDISSQILLQLIAPQPTGTWLDACAGAGGKTLQLAKMLGAKGSVTAYDPRPRALDELNLRLKRSRIRNVTVTRDPPYASVFDGVLVDAPCSGTGTWRRHPFLIRQTRESDVLAAAKTQINLLNEYSQNVGPGGILVYCTCSLSRFENQNVARLFNETNPDFEHLPLANRFGLEERDLGITVYPTDFNGDGLYVATFQRVLQ